MPESWADPGHKKWQKKKPPSSYRNGKLHVHRTIKGKGIVGRLINGTS